MSGSSRPPLYPLSWGWNANGRAGNLTDIEMHIPSHVQHSKGKVFINATAGKHHSILISESGNMFSVGENRKGQLGYGNRFKEEPSQEKCSVTLCKSHQVVVLSLEEICVFPK